MSSQMTDLPEPQVFDGVVLNKSGLYTATVNGYTATQMREYRNAALEEAAKVCDEVQYWSGSWNVKECAENIRALKEVKP